ncbi:MAG TPA: endolytic transglycosylase MltG [Burkholderiaceae bacterium]|nr:endolytic transglycosylase MltG [Burkholderiaceae bacterium]
MVLQRKWVMVAGAVVLACAVVLALSAWVWMRHPIKLAAPVRLDVVPGTGVREAARMVASAAGISSKAFEQLLAVKIPPQRLRAGTYEIAPGITPLGIVDKFARGEVVLAQLTIVEGWNFAQLRSALMMSGSVKLDMPRLTDDQIMERLGAYGVSPEGRFMPDTYRYPVGSDELTVLRMAYQAMKEGLADAWARRAPNLPLESPDEALILASIVEKETGDHTERPMIAAVFINRLRLGMKLQTDPTVIYGLREQFDGDLRKRDLQTDHPYNTYTRTGLPPTPIAMPGRKSIEAALHPADSQALYFVARGDGTSEFSNHLADHNRAVQRYQKSRQ